MIHALNFDCITFMHLEIRYMGHDMDIGHTVETVITHQLANEKSHHYKILAILKIYQILVKT